MKKIIRILVITILFGTIPAPAQTAPAQLDSLVNRALRVSPKIKMLKAKLSAAENMVPPVSNLPDPMLSLGLMNLPTNSFSFSQEPMTGKIVGLSQMIPFPGKLSTMGKAAEKNTEIVNEELKDAENEIVKNVTNTYYELAFTRKTISIVKESRKLLKSIADVVRTRYSVSSASQQNLLKVELEITNVNDKLEELHGKESMELSMLNSLLLLPADSPIGIRENLDVKYFSLTQGMLDSLAKANRPFLKGIDIAEQKATLQKSLAEYDYYPNFNLSLQYTQRDQIAKTNTDLHDLVSVMVGVTLPLNYGGKVSAKVQEKEAMEDMYNQQYSASMQMLDANFGTAIAKLNTIKSRIKLIEEGLLPQAEQTLKAAMAGYQVGKIDFINVIDSENKLYQIETNLYKLKTDYLKEIASLEFLVGTKF